jgi:uncharacterized protein YeaO (DUF488 family)
MKHIVVAKRIMTGGAPEKIDAIESPTMIRLKRVYEEPSAKDGMRILVDRLWPRGLTKERAAVDLWAKEVAPSTELRKWFHHDPARWAQFERRYRKELEAQADALAQIRQKARRGTVTLVYGARDPDRNQAVILKKVLGEHGSR